MGTSPDNTGGSPERVLHTVRPGNGSEVLTAARAVTSALSPSEQDEVFAGTARRAYPLAVR